MHVRPRWMNEIKRNIVGTARETKKNVIRLYFKLLTTVKKINKMNKSNYKINKSDLVFNFVAFWFFFVCFFWFDLICFKPVPVVIEADIQMNWICMCVRVDSLDVYCCIDTAHWDIINYVIRELRRWRRDERWAAVSECTRARYDFSLCSGCYTVFDFICTISNNTVLWRNIVW